MSTTPVTATNTNYTITDDEIPHSFKQGMAEIDLIARAEKAEAECLGQALLLGISGSREAALLSEIEQLEIELARLYTDLERFTGHGLLDCHQICDQRDAAVAELAAEREKVRVLREALERLYGVVKAAGTMNLSRGVQLGQISWYHKAEDAMADAHTALAATKEASK